VFIILIQIQISMSFLRLLDDDGEGDDVFGESGESHK
jgi:hypothetical protein